MALITIRPLSSRKSHRHLLMDTDDVAKLFLVRVCQLMVSCTPLKPKNSGDVCFDLSSLEFDEQGVPLFQLASILNKFLPISSITLDGGPAWMPCSLSLFCLSIHDGTCDCWSWMCDVLQTFSCLQLRSASHSAFFSSASRRQALALTTKIDSANQ